jgi:hypothetical protein
MENQESSDKTTEINESTKTTDTTQNSDTTSSSEAAPELLQLLRESQNKPIGPETIHIRRAGSGPPPALDSEPIPEPISVELARTRTSYVRTMITKIERYLKDGKTKDEIEQMPHVPKFKKEYTALYNMIMTPGYDKQMLYTMLALLEKMGRAEMSQHDASVIIGQRLFDKHIHK